MYSREHAAVGALVSAVALVPLATDGASVPLLGALFAYGVGLSVFVDLDHFLIARLIAGDWRHLRRVLTREQRVTDQSSMFAGIRDFERERIFSHVLLGGALVGLWSLVWSYGAVFTAVVLYAHLVGDLLWDMGVVTVGRPDGYEAKARE